jgi:23S rRNA (pseudouridine1915-N3)-methyltransferase
MKLRLIQVGKNRNPHLEALSKEYLERIRRFLPCEILELRESTRHKPHQNAASESAEGKALLALLEQSEFSVLLDVEGQELDSAGIASFLESRIHQGLRRVDIFAAGPWGWPPTLRGRADARWSLSRLTLPHELARVLLLEQLFRALARLNHFPYDK